jgi:hypothetical protein
LQVGYRRCDANRGSLSILPLGVGLSETNISATFGSLKYYGNTLLLSPRQNLRPPPLPFPSLPPSSRTLIQPSPNPKEGAEPQKRRSPEPAEEGRRPTDALPWPPARWARYLLSVACGDARALPAVPLPQRPPQRPLLPHGAAEPRSARPCSAFAEGTRHFWLC